MIGFDDILGAVPIIVGYFLIDPFGKKLVDENSGLLGAWINPIANKGVAVFYTECVGLSG